VKASRLRAHLSAYSRLLQNISGGGANGGRKRTAQRNAIAKCGIIGVVAYLAAA